MTDRDLQAALESHLLAMGDDEFLLGHRNSEWCGYAPILEEDIAFANLALDEIGHATTWYALLAELSGQDPETYPDQLVYERDASDFRNVRLVELPKGDWAFSMLRQYLFDAYEFVKLPSLAGSQYQPLAEAATKIRTEEIYHYRHTRAWVRRLGLGTEESRSRLQRALEQLWPLVPALFSPMQGEEILVEAGYLQPSAGLWDSWRAQVIPFLEECGLQLPEQAGRTDESDGTALHGREAHTPQLSVLVAELQSVARFDPQARW